VPTAVHDQVDGLLIEPRSSEQIVQAVTRLIEDGQLRRKSIQQGYRLAETQTSEYQAYRLAKLMSDCLAGRDVLTWGRDLEAVG